MWPCCRCIVTVHIVLKHGLRPDAGQQCILCLNLAWLQVCLSVHVVGEHTLTRFACQSIFCLEMPWLQVRYSSPHYASTCLPASSVCIWQPIQFQCQRFRGKLSSPMLEDKQHTLLPYFFAVTCLVVIRALLLLSHSMLAYSVLSLQCHFLTSLCEAQAMSGCLLLLVVV